MAASTSSAARNTSSERTTALRRPLPHGACNYRDLTSGLTCGCRRFWDSGGHNGQGSTSAQKDAEQQPWCICGHHACFHHFTERTIPPSSREKTSSPTSASALRKVHGKAPIYGRLVQARDDGKFQLVIGSQVVGTDNSDGNTVGGLDDTGTDQHIQRHDFANNLPYEPRASSLPDTQPPSDGSRSHRDERPLSVSQASTSCLPRIPSMCMLNSEEDRNPQWLQSADKIGEEKADNAAFARPSTSVGLGIQTGLSATSPSARKRQNSGADNCDGDLQALTRLNDPSGLVRRNSSLGRTFMQQFLEPGRIIPSLEVPCILPGAVGQEDVLQSATEVATPSMANTPDLRNLDQAVQGTKALVDVLQEEITSAGNAHASDKASSGHKHTPTRSLSPVTRPTYATSPPAQQEALRAALRNGSIQQFLPHLQSLREYLNNFSSMSMSIQSLTERMDNLESVSFSYVPEQELLERFETVDGRLLEIENWKDDHDRHHAALDADNRNFVDSHAVIAASFDSHQSSRSHASGSAGALALPTALEKRFTGLEERVEDLEAIAPPSYSKPWEIEIVLLPWGRELKGIWFSPDDLMHQLSRVTTQDSEEWTQAQSHRSGSKSSIPMLGSEGSGWSSQAIHYWADSASEWLSPRACGTNGAVYKRLQSRGFVRKVTIRKPGARDIQTAIVSSFGELLEALNSSLSKPTEDQDSQEDEGFISWQGLKAPYIPLRKVHKASRLRLLSPSELVTSALWDAEFLASNVIMRAKGQKRLFITHRSAYLQRSDDQDDAWTWQRLRELPRVRLSPEATQQPDNNSGVGEADAKEACWAYHSNLDPPVSAQSSFSSDGSIHSHGQASHSSQLSLRLADQPRKGLPHQPHTQPITPVSSRPRILRCARTASAPLTEAATAPEPQQQAPNSKRRPSLAPSASAPQQIKQPKRRRLTEEHTNLSSSSPIAGPSRQHSRTSSRHVNLVDFDDQISRAEAGWGFTPRRSKEPPSPFFSEAQDARARPSSSSQAHAEQAVPGSSAGTSSSARERRERDNALVEAAVGMASKAPQPGRGTTPFAYATPYSGNYVPGGDTEVDGDAESWDGVNEDEEDAMEGLEDSGEAEESSEEDVLSRLERTLLGEYDDELELDDDEGSLTEEAEDSGEEDEDEVGSEYVTGEEDEDDASMGFRF